MSLYEKVTLHVVRQYVYIANQLIGARSDCANKGQLVWGYKKLSPVALYVYIDKEKLSYCIRTEQQLNFAHSYNITQ